MKRFLSAVVIVLLAVFIVGGVVVAQDDIPSPEPVPVTAVKLNVESMTLVAGGQNGILRATISPLNATDTTLTWTSSNTSVATVAASSDAIVTPVGPGTAIITVQTQDGNFTDSAEITVLASDDPALPALPSTGAGSSILLMTLFGTLALGAAVPLAVKSRIR